MATLLDEPVDGRPVSRGATTWREPVRDEPDDRDEAHDDGLNTTVEDPSPEMISLDFALKTGCFEGFEGKRMTFLYTTQLTCSNVMSTVVTARPIDTSAKRKTKQPSAMSSNQHETTGPNAFHVYAQSSNPKKVKKTNGKYQAQLPSFHRSLPALPIPVARLNRELRQERDKFMQQLHRERDEKLKLDNWAATKIQACYRGFRARPRVVSYELRQHLNTVSAIRLDLSDMEHSLAQQPSTADDDSQAPAAQWRKEIQSRAVKKREFRATKERKQYAATHIQAIVRGFLTRCAFAHLYARHADEVVRAAIVRIQCLFRAFRLRSRMALVVAKLQQHAAIQIQSLIRGIQARERVLTLTFERKCEQLRGAGKPLQFTLPKRTHEIVHTSCLRVLFAHRKTPQQLAFKSPSWYDERQLLQIYKVATKLNVQRQWLLRLTGVAPSPTRRRKRGGGSLVRQPTTTRLPARLSASGPAMLTSTPSSPTNGRRRGTPTSSSTPTSSRPSSPTTRIP